MYVVAIGTFTHGGMMEAEAWSTSLGILGVQVKVAQFTPERKTHNELICKVQGHLNYCHAN